jgi:PIN domain nuclease of toxin-antitoxin system
LNLLLDTNALLWWLNGSERLGGPARSVISNPRNVVYVSAASAWEIAIKLALGKLAVSVYAGNWLPEALRVNRFTALAITVEHALAVEHLPPHHTDPFDRLLLAQAVAENLTIVTADVKFEPYAVPLIRC